MGVCVGRGGRERVGGRADVSVWVGAGATQGMGCVRVLGVTSAKVGVVGVPRVQLGIH